MEIIKDLFENTSFLYLTIVGLGSFFGYIFAKWQSLKEITKISIENNTKRIEQLEKLFKIDEERIDILLSTRVKLGEFRNLIKSNEIDRAIKLREDILDDFLLKYINKTYRYYRFSRWLSGNSKKELIREELFPFLQNCRIMIEQNLNYQVYLEKLQQKEFKIAYSNFEFAFNYIDDNLGFWKTKDKVLLEKYKKFFAVINPTDNF